MPLNSKSDKIVIIQTIKMQDDEYLVSNKLKYLCPEIIMISQKHKRTVDRL
jgi:hypothetical protein